MYMQSLSKSNYDLKSEFTEYLNDIVRIFEKAVNEIFCNECHICGNTICAGSPRRANAKSAKQRLHTRLMMEEQKSNVQKDSILAAYLPKLEAIGAYYKKASGTVFEPTETKSGELRASMLIFDGLKRESKYSAAKKNAEAYTYKTKHAKQTLILDTTREYYSYFDSNAALEAVKFKKSELDEQIKKFSILAEMDLRQRLFTGGNSGKKRRRI